MVPHPAAAIAPNCSSRGRRRRRTSDEVVRLLLDAALHEFERNGFAGTTTAAIARRADVVELLIFKHFGSKARLFEDAIFRPLNEQFLAFSAAQFNNGSADTSGARYVADLYDFLDVRGRMLMTLAVRQAYDVAEGGDLGKIEGLETFFRQTSEQSAARYTDGDAATPMLMARISFATILACIVFRRWLLPPGIASDGKVRAAIADFVQHGIASRRGPSASPGPAS